jgi:hypothetical protein
LSCQLPAGLAKDALADFQDQAGLFGHRDEIHGRNDYPAFLFPADQRLGADDPAYRQI